MFDLGSVEYKAPYEDMESGKYCSLLENLQVIVSKQKMRPSFPACLHRNRVRVELNLEQVCCMACVLRRVYCEV